MSEERRIFNNVIMKNGLKNIFFAGLTAVKPHILIPNKIVMSDNHLYINDKRFYLGSKVYLIGFGKAVMGMAIEMEKLLGDRLTRGIISVPRGSIKKLSMNLADDSIIHYYESGKDNVADSETLKITRDIMDLAKSLEKEDTLIVLISGGGSALLALPKPPVTLEEKNEIWKKLQNIGADIKEVNVIRQKLSMIKAGGLVNLAYPAKVISLILSDIIGDPIELIAGGPTCYNLTDLSSEIIKIFNKYNLYNKIEDEKMKFILLQKEVNNVNRNRELTHVENLIIGNNSCAIDAAKNEALEKGLNAIILFNDIEGSVKDISCMYVEVTRVFCKMLDKLITKKEFREYIKYCEYLKKIENQIDEIFNIVEDCDEKKEGLVLIGGGEPTVEVRGSFGKGGRNQELALQFSIDWSKEISKTTYLKEFEIIFLSAATDGQDGPTDAAGAFGYAEIAASVDMKAEEFLVDNNSYNFYSNFEDGRDLLKTGLTGTNVMDLHFLYIRRKKGIASTNEKKGE